jgi:ribonuclease P protein subunit RPR2
MRKDRDAALKTIRELFEKAFHATPELAAKYVKQARRAGMKNQVRIPKELRRHYCRHCFSLFKHGTNVRVRRTPKGIVYTCLQCQKQTRISL